MAQSKLSEGKHQEALPAATCCLRYSIDVHGPDTVQLVPAYLLLAEANMGERTSPKQLHSSSVDDDMWVSVHLQV